MPHLHQTAAIEGAYELLIELRKSSETIYSRDTFLGLMNSQGIADAEVTVHEFVAGGLLVDRGGTLSLTSRGVRASLLLEAVNGADLQNVFRQLSRLDVSLRTYQLVREGMTRTFVNSLSNRPGFGRLYFCSPWINLFKDHERTIAAAVHQHESVHGTPPEILVITRPEQGTDLTIPKNLKPLQDLGATIWLNSRLHSKLYIREPDLSGGFSMAVVGSQNMTRSKYLELGIQVNSDNALINQLVRYFLELTAYSDEQL